MATEASRRSGHALGIDFGTSNTVAVARWPDGRARPILIDGSPLLPSAVYAQPDGQLIVGRDAVHSARLDPARFEANPKRRVDDGTVLLGDHEVPVSALFSAVFARVAEEWHRAVGPVRPEVTLTCPATWGAARRTLLAGAAADAGLTGARLVAEPVAAATYFADVLGRDVPIGSVVVVHDFGAGTFDASVVARTAEGFEVLAVDGRDDIGGLDVDAAIVEHLGQVCAARDDAAWQRLQHPVTVEQRRAQRQLWDDVRVAKERLSRTQSADLMVPLLDREVRLTRDELEALAGPLLSQTVQVTQEVMRWVGLAEGRLAGVFLVGGASRIPLVATLLHRALGAAPVVIEQPELVVAEGSILAAAALLATGPAAPGPTSELRLISARGGAVGAGAMGAAAMGAGVGGAEATVPGAPLAATPATTWESAPWLGNGTETAWSGDDAETVRPGAAAQPAWPGAAARSAWPGDEAQPAWPGETAQPNSWPGAAGQPGWAGDDAETAWSGDDAETAWSGDDAGTARSVESPPPAVDPWPHARDDAWVPDPNHTVLSAGSWQPEPAWDPAPDRPATGVGPTDPALPGPTGTRRLERTRAELTRAESTKVEPARPESTRAAAARTEATRTEATRRDSTRKDSTRRDSVRADTTRAESTQPEPIRAESSRFGAARIAAFQPERALPEQARPEQARPELARPELARPELARPEQARPETVRSGAVRSGAGRSTAVTAKAATAKGATSKAARPEAARPVPVQPEPLRLPAARKGSTAQPVRTRRPRRRRGRFVRFLQVMISMFFLLTVPVVATVVAYGYGNGLPIEEDAWNLARDLAREVLRLLGRW